MQRLPRELQLHIIGMVGRDARLALNIRPGKLQTPKLLIRGPSEHPSCHTIELLGDQLHVHHIYSEYPWRLRGAEPTIHHYTRTRCLGSKIICYWTLNTNTNSYSLAYSFKDTV